MALRAILTQILEFGRRRIRSPRWQLSAAAGVVVAALVVGALVSRPGSHPPADGLVPSRPGPDSGCQQESSVEVDSEPPTQGCGAGEGALAAGSSLTAGGFDRIGASGGRGRATSITTLVGSGGTTPYAPPGHDPGPITTTTSGDLRLSDRSAPEVSQLRAGGEVPDGPDEIFDDQACGSTSIPVEAVVIDQSRIRSVTLYWSFAGSTGRVAGSTPMHATGGKYGAVFGPFAHGTAPNGTSVVIRWWVEATDDSGNTGRADAPDASGTLAEDERITLTACPS